jgi:hypothetical protein
MSEHIKRTFVVENQWKCSACGNLNPGRDLKCQKCAQTKQKVDVDQVDAEAAPEVSDEKLLAMANAGENVACPFCGSQERRTDGKCRNCGSRVEEGTEKLPDAAPPAGAPALAKPAAKPVPPAPTHTKRNLVIGGLLCLVLGVGYCFMPHSKATRVQSIAWEYELDLQQKRIEHQQGFTHPAEAYNLSCQQRQNGTHDCDAYKCNPHTVKVDCNPHECKCHKVSKDKKNGFSEVQEVCDTCMDKCDKTVEDTCQHQCPTMAQWCSYDVVSWQTLSTQRETGVDHSPRWPTLSATDPVNQRVEKKEKYRVVFVDAAKTFTAEPSTLADFNRFNVGAAWKINVTAVGTVTPVQPL